MIEFVNELSSAAMFLSAIIGTVVVGSRLLPFAEGFFVRDEDPT